MKKRKSGIYIKRYKRGNYFISVDNNGKIDGRRRVKGSKISLTRAKEIYKKNKTFYEERTRYRLTKVNEFSEIRSSGYENRSKKIISRRPKRDAQYTVSGYYGKYFIAVRSFKIGSDPNIMTSSQAKEDAWHRFLMMVGKEIGNNYDEDEGIKHIDRIKNIKEGWVYYR